MDSVCLVSLVQDGSDNVMKLGMFLWQHLVESLPQRIKAVLKARGGQLSTSKIYFTKWPVSVFYY